MLKTIVVGILLGVVSFFIYLVVILFLLAFSDFILDYFI